MKIYYVGLLALGFLWGSAGFVMAQKPDVGELIRELSGEKAAADRTAEQRVAVYGQVLDALMPDLASEDTGKRDHAQRTLEKIAFRASRPRARTDRSACARAIAARLGPKGGPLARVWLLRQLERMGREEVVPQIAPLLADRDALVRESARRALQKNPATEANAALQKALGSADNPAWRVALINALAQRSALSNLNLLLKEAASGNDEIRTAAVLGLAKLGDPAAIEPMAAASNKGSPAARGIAQDACLRLAEALVRTGNKTIALAIYKKMLGSKGHVKCAALIGISRAGSEDDLPILVDALADQDVKLRGACIEALGQLQGPKVTEILAAQARTAKPEIKAALLQALTQRGDRQAVSVFLAAANDDNEVVCVAALQGLGTLGNTAAVPVLLKAAAINGKPQEIARQSLQSLPGTDIDKTLVQELGEKDPKVRVEVIRALAARHVVAATESLLQAAEDADSGVRNESLRALGVLASANALAPLAAVLVKTQDEGSRNEAANALFKIASRDRDLESRSAPILKALDSSRGPARISLLSVLGRIGGQKSLEGVRAALKDQDDKVKDAAIRALAEWPDATAASDLLHIARSAASETHQVLAVRGYIRVCSIRTDRPEAETAKMLVVGLETARRPDEKKNALGGLAEVRDILALQAVVPCLSNEALKEEAASAAVRIGRDIADRNPEAVKEAMEKVLNISKNDGLKREAREVFDRVVQKLKEAKPKK